ncbi:hypothetical protein G7085_04450 [Tessaracoccus sp. HDW20]|uniref:hypothetical protein n=1 Tax=Tessaracoccus coleopterorum TaxID=2714950 RepID=UPI0018D3DBAD|nr:hypothetical protein [Tessaracoccus coleopterorum]NHB84136.1 hypothetical protein [Tessaracoccus coleopterorum]
MRGSGYRTYSTTVTSPAGIDSLVATCSCPMRMDCKHTVALILTMRTPGRHRQPPTWQQVLAPFGGRGTSSGRPWRCGSRRRAPTSPCDPCGWAPAATGSAPAPTGTTWPAATSSPPSATP